MTALRSVPPAPPPYTNSHMGHPFITNTMMNCSNLQQQQLPQGAIAHRKSHSMDYRQLLNPGLRSPPARMRPKRQHDGITEHAACASSIHKFSHGPSLHHKHDDELQQLATTAIAAGGHCAQKKPQHGL
ncbi:hypothetical protein Ddc_15527 [Ditylenchus destructor]|nr:hypothetical protein Ddc_15527 [Ditylenchus destructor]